MTDRCSNFTFFRRKAFSTVPSLSTRDQKANANIYIIVYFFFQKFATFHLGLQMHRDHYLTGRCRPPGAHALRSTCFDFDYRLTMWQGPGPGCVVHVARKLHRITPIRLPAIIAAVRGLHTKARVGLF